MSLSSGDGSSAPLWSSDISVGKLYNRLRAGRNDERIQVECHKELILIYAEKLGCPKIINSLQVLFAGRLKSYLTDAEINNIFEILNSNIDKNDSKEIYTYIKLLQAQFQMFAFNDPVNAQKNCEEIQDFFQTPSFRTDKTSRDMFNIYNTLKLAFADLSNDENDIEKFTKLLLPNGAFFYTDRIKLAFNYGTALYFYHKRRFKKTNQILYELLIHSQTKTPRDYRIMLLYVITCLLTEKLIDQTLIDSHSNISILLSSNFDKNLAASQISESDTDLRIGLELLEQLNEHRSQYSAIEKALMPYYRVRISYVAKETGFSEEIIKNYIKNTDLYAIHGDIIIRKPKPIVDLSTERELLKSTEKSFAQRSHHFKIRFSDSTD
ncbi:hypothetical protein TVAG_009350 [Trichomonas vaginalis G3]|uniref:Uncharacterized protein n=1 Tax=Trichomonas vaginalis (strain ATCC PRA-98 / G3) TaxID=412133 RepID=A2FYV3_TRIV3|nr:hypothetical protein TVAGG3_0416430 [Trichomonas vaginalis G3]EAX89915.1 hypothetical protein TVAG_009350 [Trichomonas vaginalis G3]KAI5535738.1 hypothetical protein TVAGG3_0416430 [Trichomonas vaginalis G3]|eukprot:XP_001302845.1 hypothetical protein [Trichomonas vaginalis G3]